MCAKFGSFRLSFFNFFLNTIRQIFLFLITPSVVWYKTTFFHHLRLVFIHGKFHVLWWMRLVYGLQCITKLQCHV